MIARLAEPTPDRLLVVAQAMRDGFGDEAIHAACRIDPWFLARIREIVEAERQVESGGLPGDPDALGRLKGLGFSDARLAALTGAGEADVAAARRAAGVRPVYKRIDTCAAEFASITPYMYSCYESGPDPECEAEPSDREKVIILGGGPNRIGQGIEFDYCCVHAVYALAEAGYETIMVNCNPETVSTDYDTSDRLYFEPLTAEDAIEICRKEQSAGRLKGVIVQYGGQTPLKLAHCAGRCRRADPRHLARRHRPGRGPRPLPAPAARDRPAPAQQRHGDLDGAGRRRRPGRSAIRCCCARPTSWAAGRWKSSTTRPACAVT